MRRPHRPQCRRPRSWYGLVEERTVRGRSPGSRVPEVSRSWTRVRVSFDTRAGCARSVLVTTRSGPLFRKTVTVAGGDVLRIEQPLDTVPAAPDLVAEVPGVGEDGADGGS